jgi:hypothetical protein
MDKMASMAGGAVVSDKSIFTPLGLPALAHDPE